MLKVFGGADKMASSYFVSRVSISGCDCEKDFRLGKDKVKETENIFRALTVLKTVRCRKQMKMQAKTP